MFLREQTLCRRPVAQVVWSVRDYRGSDSLGSPEVAIRRRVLCFWGVWAGGRGAPAIFPRLSPLRFFLDGGDCVAHGCEDRCLVATIR